MDDPERPLSTMFTDPSLLRGRMALGGGDMKNTFITNAVITSAEVTIDRGFILSAWLQLNYGGAMIQGFGGYALHMDKSSDHHEKSKSRNFTGIFLMRVMEVAGVKKWSDLKGKTIRVEKTDEWGDIIRIGHIVNDDWFNPKVELREVEL